ncbi:beta-galactosidase [Mucilaginibacter sp. OK098]|uniref:beta-galactosidase n=1 Tax=Mucilaginibacter sp. OK098 TaxID=1855297 RepID=UPI000912E776|nr:beta-galactosidase [Mucilaginibacter sp. OK098]SHN13212.1 Beta-galactosidase [Mucilaginibacter sp. OK098]
MGKISLILLIIIAFNPIIGIGSEKVSPVSLRKHSITINGVISDTSKYETQIPTIAWIGVPQNQSSLIRYQELKASGITQSFYPFTDANAVQTAIDLAQKAGVKLFISCPELATDPEKIVKRFMNHPAIAGYYLVDEPGRAAFPTLALLVKRIRAIDDKHMCYINLLPNDASITQLGVKSYQEYLDTYIKEVPVQALSFDHYPIMSTTEPLLHALWYKNLEMVSEAAKKSHKPFWAFALTVAFTPYPVPTLGSIRLQVYSDLAYGAQAIEYFTYWTVSDGVIHNFHNASIAIDGTKTDVYGKIQQMNKEIKGLSGVFFGAKVISIAHTGNSIPDGTKRLNQLPKPITMLKTDGLGAVVSVLKKNRDLFLVIVNRDYINPMILTIKCARGVSKILKDGSLIPQGPGGNKIKIEPGDIAIYRWSDRKN